MRLTDPQLWDRSPELQAKGPRPVEKIKKPRSQEESREQRKVMNWWEQFHPNFKLHRSLLHSVPNGGFRSIVTASIMKAEGQRRGVFDLKLNVARGHSHGLWIEMKAKDGRLSPDQEQFKLAVETQGYATSTCYSSAEAINTITNYLSI